MPIEATLLHDQAVPFASCPECYVTPFEPFMRGCVQRSKRRWLIGKKQDYCAIICSSCQEIVGYESPKIVDNGQAPTID
jgi:hypothetical protein